MMPEATPSGFWMHTLLEAMPWGLRHASLSLQCLRFEVMDWGSAPTVGSDEGMVIVCWPRLAVAKVPRRP